MGIFFSPRRNMLTLIVSGLCLMVTTIANAEELEVAQGRKVSLEYTATLEDKSIFGSNVGKEPMVYVHGSDEPVPLFAEHLVGLKADETKKFEVPPEEAYGPLNPEKVIEVPTENVPEEWPKAGAGAKFGGQGPKGKPLYARVVEVKDKTIVIDTNHPLAGKKLFFDVKILKVETEEPQKTQSDAEPGTKPKK